METAAAFHPFKKEMAALPGLSMWQNEVEFAYYPQCKSYMLAYDCSN